MNKYCFSPLMFWLLFSSTGRAQEKDTLLILKDSLLIHFDFGRSLLRRDARAAIDSELSLHGSSSSLTGIVLSGHCDSIGGDVYNDGLSLERISSVRDYLRSRGISDNLFSGMNGYGRQRPLNDNADENKRSLNRRVEIVLYFLKKPVVAGPPATLQVILAPPDPAPPLTLSDFFRDSARTGKSYVLRNLNFISGRHLLMAYSDTILKELLHIMLDSPGLKIEIRGHVCCIPEYLDGLDFDTNTNDLSVRRARFVYEYLRQGGVKASRMSYRGFGASLKLYPLELDEVEKERNRRVEIKVVSRKR